MSPPPSGTSTPRLALDLATLIGLIAALVYIADWSYAERYLAHFQYCHNARAVRSELCVCDKVWCWRWGRS